MLTCQFCGLKGSYDYFQLDKLGNGFWCEECDGFTYLEGHSTKHRFTLITECVKGKKINGSYSGIKFSKRLSPLRYPGGKSKVIDYLYTHLQATKSNKLVSPYTGGGSFELAMLNAGVVEELHLNDIDRGIYALWWAIKHRPDYLAEKLINITPTHKDFFNAQQIIKDNYSGSSILDSAWATLVVNRLAYSGIPRANPLGGKNGSSEMLLSRWNSNDLLKRINYIHSLSDRITITNMDALELIEEAYWDNSSTIFIDPPYVEKGKALYNSYYSEQDHRDLAFLLEQLHFGCPGADLVVTYDYHSLIEEIYELPQHEVLGRTYSA